MRGNTKKFALKSAVAVAATAPWSCRWPHAVPVPQVAGKPRFRSIPTSRTTRLVMSSRGSRRRTPTLSLDVQYGQDPAQYISTLQTRLAGGKAPTIFNLTMDNRTDVMKSGAALDISGEDFLYGIDDTNFALFQQDGQDLRHAGFRMGGRVLLQQRHSQEGRMR